MSSMNVHDGAPLQPTQPNLVPIHVSEREIKLVTVAEHEAIQKKQQRSPSGVSAAPKSA